MKFSLRNKIMVMFSLGLVAVTLILISAFSSEVHHRYKELVLERGHHVVDGLVFKTTNLLDLGLYPSEFTGYEKLLEEALNSTEGILYLAFLSPDGEPFYQSGVVAEEFAQLAHFNPASSTPSGLNHSFINKALTGVSPQEGFIFAILDEKLVETKTMNFVSTTLVYAGLISLIAISFVLLFLRANLGVPLKRLVIQINNVDLNKPNQTDEVLTARHDEIGLVARTFDSMLKGLVISQTHLAKTNEELTQLTHELEDRVALRTQELERANKQLKALAHVDVLTGFYNRLRLKQVLGPRFEHAKRNNHSFAILMVDLDGFKQINDDYGHAAGDEALSVIGERIRSSLRYGDSVFRYGGDEFVFIFEGYPDWSSLLAIVNKIKEAILQPVIYDNEVLPFGVSIGVASTDHCDCCTADQLMVQADKAMYEAKSRNLVYFVGMQN